MTPKQKRRLIATSLILAGVAAAVALALTALSGNLNYLYSPSTMIDEGLQPGHRFRLGGVVLEQSIRRVEGLHVRFTVTDRVKEREVAYEGILPDLFREGQSVIAHGELGADGVFVANKILAKHDETYMPAEVMEAMRKAQEGNANGNPQAQTPYSTQRVDPTSAGSVYGADGDASAHAETPASNADPAEPPSSASAVTDPTSSPNGSRP